MHNPETKKAAIAARLRVAREQAGLSQGQVARMLGMHRPSISEAEAGRRNVSAAELATFAEIYGVDFDWLVQAESETVDQAKLELAARELAKLKPEDLQAVIDLLQSLAKEKGA